MRVEEALAEALPGVEPRTLRAIETGWDSVADPQTDVERFRTHVLPLLDPTSARRRDEVMYGLFLGDMRWVSSGLAGVRERLPKVTGTPDTMAW